MWLNNKEQVTKR